MPFPEINQVLVCEDVRREMGRKNTILGFYGVAPNVLILFKELNKPIDRLTFLFVAGPGEGKYKLSFTLIGEDKHLVSQSREQIEIKLEGPQRIQIIISVAPVTFPRPGKYHFELIIDGHVHHRLSFQVDQGKPGDFA